MNFFLFLSGGQFPPAKGGQFEPARSGQLKPANGGQFYRRIQAQYAVLKEVYEKYQLLQKEQEKLKEKLLQYENPDDGYRKDWTWVAKIVFVLERAGKPPVLHRNH